MDIFNYIRSKFIEVHINEIDNYDILDKYINFLLNYNKNLNNIYTEKHHILPRSVFPEYTKEPWNLVELSYDDHKLAHLLLFEAINIRKYQRPLNYMIPYYKNKETISNAAKRGWENLKKDKTKFEQFKRKRSEFMKTLSSEEQSRRARLFWDNITTKKYNDYCKKIKYFWTKEKRKQKSIEMKKYYENDNNRIKKSIESKEVWDARSADFRLKFKNKMNNINKDIIKRKKAGKALKELWNDPVYLNKMKNRKTKPGQKHIIIYADGTEKIYNTMQEIINKCNFSAFYIRRYRNTNKPIDIKDLNDNNLELLGAKINKIN